MTNLNVLIQTYYQRKENEIQNSTELHQLDTIEINYHINTNFYRRKFLEIKQKNLNVRHKIYEDKLNALDRELGQYIYTTIQKIENKRRDLLCKGLTRKEFRNFIITQLMSLMQAVNAQFAFKMLKLVEKWCDSTANMFFAKNALKDGLLTTKLVLIVDTCFNWTFYLVFD